jgi:small multidrug resistance pump
MPWIYLAVAVVFETVAFTALQASQKLTRPGPTAVFVLGYGAAFYLLALTLQYLPAGVVYAIWSGLGVCLIAVIAWLLFGQTLDGPAVLGLALIVAGIVIIQVFSDTARH